MRRFAISDIHGCRATFEKMLTEVLQLQKEDTLYLLGDYIDRGPDSRGVIDHIWALQKEGYQVHCLRGNHEQMLLDEVDKDGFWYKGNRATLDSFQIKSNQGIPKP